MDARVLDKRSSCKSSSLQTVGLLRLFYPRKHHFSGPRCRNPTPPAVFGRRVLHRGFQLGLNDAMTSTSADETFCVRVVDHKKGPQELQRDAKQQFRSPSARKQGTSWQDRIAVQASGSTTLLALYTLHCRSVLTCHVLCSWRPGIELVYKP